MNAYWSRRPGAIAAVIVILLAIAGCGDSPGQAQQTTPVVAPATATPTISSAGAGTPTSLPPTIAVSDAVTGTVLVENGRSMTGGTEGDTIEIEVSFSASSTAGEVKEMRVRAGSGGCARPGQMEAHPWEPFASAKVYTTSLFINIHGWYASAQYRDDQGNVSPVLCDDISVEGMPRR